MGSCTPGWEAALSSQLHFCKAVNVHVRITFVQVYRENRRYKRHSWNKYVSKIYFALSCATLHNDITLWLINVLHNPDDLSWRQLRIVSLYHYRLLWCLLIASFSYIPHMLILLMFQFAIEGLPQIVWLALIVECMNKNKSILKH